MPKKHFFLQIQSTLGALFASMWMASSALAGPVIVGGTDADDHGSATASANLDGWLFMQRAFESVAARVTNGHKIVACLGCNNQAAANAFFSAFDKSSLPAQGWTRVVVNTNAEITNFFTTASVPAGANILTTGIVYMPSDRINALGGLTEAQLDIINVQAGTLSQHVDRGGGLFTQTQSGLTNGFGWLKSLLPGLAVGTDRIPETPVLNLRPRATADFAALSQSSIGAAAQWHNYFFGRFGGLDVLADGALTGAAEPGAVVLGGANVSFSSSQTVPVGGGVWGLALVAALGTIGARHRARRALGR